ncbi:hypothetical protein HZH68_015007 [Vespula germanica]|uniref:Uncharacterized protein n=1 Tax=Vespula germanica TaxID=30212 RepID=A0A834J752_VESGE|nr:hypothetical protein HZH68_015007 [Vespula germanica]
MNEVYEVLNQIYGSCDLKHVPIMHNDIKDMKLLERMIKETLLLYSVIVIIARKVTQNVEVIKNWTIPKGSSADLFNYNLHCNEKYWILPLVLDPDRFLPERCSFSNSFHLVMVAEIA